MKNRTNRATERDQHGDLPRLDDEAIKTVLDMFGHGELAEIFAGDSGTPAISRTRPTNARRTRSDISKLRSELMDVIAQYKPMTVRQVYYQAVSRGLIDKTEASYKNVVCRLLGDMRREGLLPYRWIADNTRWMRKPRTYDNLAGMLELTQQTYRRAVWVNQNVRVEIWLEKDALSGVLHDVTNKWDVPLMVTRGYPSMSYLHGAAEQIAAEDNFTYLYYFGDHDPSGVDIPRFVKQGISELLDKWDWDPEKCFAFERVAVTREQIAEFNLTTRPTKKSDSRSHNFEGESVEVDAIDPDTLRSICRDCIVKHLDQAAYGRMKAVEAAERETLRGIAGQFAGGADE